MFDAHNHLHDYRLDDVRPEVMRALDAKWLAGAAVNGTHPGDWTQVRSCCQAHLGLRPQYGLHPWRVNEAPPHWRETLIAFLETDARAGIGEIGLDRWKNHDTMPLQIEAFRFQLQLAAAQNRPTTIHCLKAWGTLHDELRCAALPERGFLLHSFGGPLEMVKEFIARGAYFSLSAYFAHPRKAEALKIFANIPINRLLLETDAPDMSGPPEYQEHPCISTSGEAINHPLNIESVYRLAANLRGIEIKELRSIIQANFLRFFD